MFSGLVGVAVGSSAAGVSVGSSGVGDWATGVELGETVRPGVCVTSAAGVEVAEGRGVGPGSCVRRQAPKVSPLSRTIATTRRIIFAIKVLLLSVYSNAEKS